MSRKQCTKDDPYTLERDKAEPGYGWEHSDVHEVDDSQENGWPCGDTVRMRCNNCGLEWNTELPQ